MFLWRLLATSFVPEWASVWATKGSCANIPYHKDPFAEADEDTGETKQSQNYIHIRIQREFTFKTQHLVARHSPRCDATSGDKPADSIYSIERNGRKTLTTVQGLPKKFDQKKILKVIKKKFGRWHASLCPRSGLNFLPSLQWHHRGR